jgi:hypothetical protein
LRLRKITDYTVQIVEDFVHEWHRFAGLDNHEMLAALHYDLDKGVTSHVLNSLVTLMHELEELNLAEIVNHRYYLHD